MSSRLRIEELSDGRVRVALRRAEHEFDEVSGEPASFASPLGEAELEDLRWYLEDYLIAPFAVYDQRGRTIQSKLAGWGEALFESLFGAGKPGRDAYIKTREGETELAVISRSPAFLGLPWELLKDPKRATPLALDLKALDRTLIAEGNAAPIPPGKALRVLMVIARPSGLRPMSAIR